MEGKFKKNILVLLVGILLISLFSVSFVFSEDGETLDISSEENFDTLTTYFETSGIKLGDDFKGGEVEGITKSTLNITSVGDYGEITLENPPIKFDPTLIKNYCDGIQTEEEKKAGKTCATLTKKGIEFSDGSIFEAGDISFDSRGNIQLKSMGDKAPVADLRNIDLSALSGRQIIVSGENAVVYDHLEHKYVDKTFKVTKLSDGAMKVYATEPIVVSRWDDLLNKYSQILNLKHGTVRTQKDDLTFFKKLNNKLDVDINKPGTDDVLATLDQEFAFLDHKTKKDVYEAYNGDKGPLVHVSDKGYLDTSVYYEKTSFKIENVPMDQVFTANLKNGVGEIIEIRGTKEAPLRIKHTKDGTLVGASDYASYASQAATEKLLKAGFGGQTMTLSGGKTKGFYQIDSEGNIKGFIDSEMKIWDGEEWVVDEEKLNDGVKKREEENIEKRKKAVVDDAENLDDAIEKTIEDKKDELSKEQIDRIEREQLFVKEVKEAIGPKGEKIDFGGEFTANLGADTYVKTLVQEGDIQAITTNKGDVIKYNVKTGEVESYDGETKESTTYQGEPGKKYIPADKTEDFNKVIENLEDVVKTEGIYSEFRENMESLEESEKINGPLGESIDFGGDNFIELDKDTKITEISWYEGIQTLETNEGDIIMYDSATGQIEVYDPETDKWSKVQGESGKAYIIPPETIEITEKGGNVELTVGDTADAQIDIVDDANAVSRGWEQESVEEKEKWKTIPDVAEDWVSQLYEATDGNVDKATKLMEIEKIKYIHQAIKLCEATDGNVDKAIQLMEIKGVGDVDNAFKLYEATGGDLNKINQFINLKLGSDLVYYVADLAEASKGDIGTVNQLVELKGVDEPSDVLDIYNIFGDNFEVSKVNKWMAKIDETPLAFEDLYKATKGDYDKAKQWIDIAHMGGAWGAGEFYETLSGDKDLAEKWLKLDPKYGADSVDDLYKKTGGNYNKAEKFMGLENINNGWYACRLYEITNGDYDKAEKLWNEITENNLFENYHSALEKLEE